MKALARTAGDRFESGDYDEAMKAISEVSEVLRTVEGIDHFLLLYLNAAVNEYSRLFGSYDSLIGSFVEENRQTLFNTSENMAYDQALSFSSRKEVLRNQLIKRVNVEKRRKLWRRLSKELTLSLRESLYLGK